MSFVKLDTGLLKSTLWLDIDATRIFIAALVLAVPDGRSAPSPVLLPDSTEFAGWELPPGRYGLVESSGPGLVSCCHLDLQAGLAALARLQAPDPYSRTELFEGRRMVRVRGGYLIINYAAYRDKDHTAAERQKRWRDRQRHGKPGANPMPVPGQHSAGTVPAAGGNDTGKALRNAVTGRYITQAEGEVDSKDIVSPTASDDTPPSKTVNYSAGFLAFWEVWPPNERKRGKGDAFKVWRKQRCEPLAARILEDVRVRAASEVQWRNGYCPMPQKYLSGRRWEDPLPAAPAERRVSL